MPPIYIPSETDEDEEEEGITYGGAGMSAYPEVRRMAAAAAAAEQARQLA